MTDTSTPIDLSRTQASTRQPMPRPERGTIIGRYVVLGLLGEGGMGTVFLAYDPELDRKVALKLLKFDTGDDATARAGLLREAQAMARLSHEHVLSVFDVGTWGTQLFITMEYVDGLDLARWLAEKPRSRAEVLDVFLAAGAGLAAAHAQGLVHRDFKPANVLVGRDGRVRVSDFGLAHLGDSLGPGFEPPAELTASPSAPTLAGKVAGTPAYMAPEQFEGLPTDARSDQFAFCVALYEALEGTRPFSGGDFAATRAAVLSGAPRAPTHTSFTRRPVLRAVLRGLSLRPADRFPSMEVLLHLLARDRVRLAKRVAGWLAIALVVSALVGVVVNDQTRCRRQASAEQAALWSAPLTSALREGLARAGLSSPQQDEAVHRLEGHVEGWRDATEAVCEAHRRSVASGWSEPCLVTMRERLTASLNMMRTQPLDPRSVSVVLRAQHAPSDCRLHQAPAAPVVPAEALVKIDLAFQLGDYAAVIDAVHPRLEGLARTDDSPAVVAALSYRLARALWMREGPVDEVPLRFTRAIAAADASSDDEVSVRARASLVEWLTDTTRFEEAERWAEDTRLGHQPSLHYEAESARTWLEAAQGHLEQVLAHAHEALAAAETLEPQGWRSAAVHNDIAVALARAGRLSEAAAEFGECARLGGKDAFANPELLVATWSNRGMVDVMLGHADAAEEDFAHAEQALASLPPRDTTAAILQAPRAEAEEWRGHLDRAEWRYQLALSRPGLLEADARAEALAGLARCALARGLTADAVALAAEAAAQTRDEVGGYTRSDVDFARAQVLAAQGPKARAEGLALARETLAALPPEHHALRGALEAWLALQR